MGVKFGMEEGTFGLILLAKFHPHRCNVSPLRGEKTKNRPLSTLNTGSFALRAMLPVINNNFAASVQSVHHQHAYMISDCRATGQSQHAASITFCSNFKVNPSLRQAFLQVIDVTNLCSVPALLHNTSNFIIYKSISMKHIRYV